MCERQDQERVGAFPAPPSAAKAVTGCRLNGPWDAGFALEYHSYPGERDEIERSRLGELVYYYKYCGQRHFGAEIVAALAAFVGNSPELSNVEVVLDVPSEPTKFGYQPARELASRLARKLRVKCHPGLIAKTRPTQPQKDLVRRKEKRGNVAGAFRLRRPEFVRGKAVLVVDDLYDSGETLHEVFRLLMGAGAREVSVLTVTRTSHHHA